MPKDVAHKPLGIITTPNRYSQYPAGALSTARNVCLRDSGVLSSMPAVRSYFADVMSNGYTIRKLYAAGSSMLAIGDSSGSWQARWVTGSASTAITTTPAGLSAATFDTAQVNVAKARERYFVTSLNDGVLALDSEGDTTVRAAGFRALNPALDSYTNTSAQCLANDTNAAWKFVWRRKQSDGYECSSEPSIGYRFQNLSGLSADPTWRIQLATSAGVSSGDFVDVYRTKTATPATTSAPGDTFYQSSSIQLTSTDISNGYLLFRDRSLDAQLGEELYTNPGRPVPTIVGVSGDNTNTPPGLSTDTWTFKNRTFYAVRRLASFLKFRINGNWGFLTGTIDRTTGIGLRTCSGTATAGSASVTGISAADMVGIVPGQVLIGNTWDVYPTVVSVGATSLVASTPSVRNGATNSTTDIIEINGIKGLTANLAYLIGDGSAVDPLIPETFYKTASQSAVVFADAYATSLTGGTATTTGTTVILRQGRYGDGVLTVRGTNPQNYSPPIADIAATATNGSYDERFNRLQWSKDSQPEAVVPTVELIYGNGAHYRGIPTNDAVFLFASDGCWRMSGVDDTYRVDPFDPKLVLAGRDAVALLGQRIYAYVQNRGLVRVSDAGVEDISLSVVNDVLPGAAYADTWDTFVTADESHREIWVSFRSGGATHSYVYNELTSTFVDVIDSEWSAAEYAPYLQSLVVGVVDTAPDVKYFELDTSTTRMANADVRFQPFTLGDAFALKDWSDVYLIFEGVGTDMTLVPSFRGTSYTARTLKAKTDESRVRIAVPRNAPGLSARITPGFTFSAGGTSNKWSLRGISVNGVPTSDEVTR